MTPKEACKQQIVLNVSDFGYSGSQNLELHTMPSIFISFDNCVQAPFHPTCTLGTDEIALLGTKASSGVPYYSVRGRWVGGEVEIFTGWESLYWSANHHCSTSHWQVQIEDFSDEEAVKAAFESAWYHKYYTRMDIARALKKACTLFCWPNHKLGEVLVGLINQKSLNQILRLNHLISQVQEYLVTKKISYSDARTLSSMSAKKQLEMANELVIKGKSLKKVKPLSKADVESYPEDEKKNLHYKTRSDIQLEDTLSEKIGSSVKLYDRLVDGNELSIRFTSGELLAGIVDKLEKVRLTPNFKGAVLLRAQDLKELRKISEALQCLPRLRGSMSFFFDDNEELQTIIDPFFEEEEY